MIVIDLCDIVKWKSNCLTALSRFLNSLELFFQSCVCGKVCQSIDNKPFFLLCHTPCKKQRLCSALIPLNFPKASNPNLFPLCIGNLVAQIMIIFSLFQHCIDIIPKPFQQMGFYDSFCPLIDKVWHDIILKSKFFAHIFWDKEQILLHISKEKITCTGVISKNRQKEREITIGIGQKTL